MQSVLQWKVQYKHVNLVIQIFKLASLDLPLSFF